MKGNIISILFGFLLGASIGWLILAGYGKVLTPVEDIRVWLTMAILFGGVFVLIWNDNVPVGETGVLTFFQAVVPVTVKTGLYFQLPGVIGTIRISSKLVTIPIVIPKPKLSDNVTLNNAKGLIAYKVIDVYAAAVVEDLKQALESLGIATVRHYLSTLDSLTVESAKVDLLTILSRDRLRVLIAEAKTKGVQICDLYFESADIPAGLEAARNQSAIETAERAAQEKELAFRTKIINDAVAAGANFAEAQAEADRVTNKRTTVTTNQITGGTGGGGARPVVVIGQNESGGNAEGGVP